ncbi:hypothetical protein LCGC14_1704040 [marine sediment metagenome]|uniref:Cysteine-rich domain-containing protein n=1 Tax=marine sediment metagenome TaxID=412755 RepID=A0A0F9JXM7_9ZZZZ|nr:disulfide reductase [Desulfobacterales bacterium]
MKISELAYYPGCSLQGTAKDYAESIIGVCESLDIQLTEVPDWNCCGATAAHSIDHRASLDLAGRILRLATKMPQSEMLVPCPMCFNRLKTAILAQPFDQKAEDPYRIPIEKRFPKIWDTANFFATQQMMETISNKVQQPLKGLKVVCYYGCMANRPSEISDETDFENPQSLDRIVMNLGATPIAWPFKTDCCGATQVLSRPDIVSHLVGNLYDMAIRVGAQAVVVSCQMCHANLDIYQEKIEADWGRRFNLPIYYFSELIGLANNVSGVGKWLSSHLTDPFPLLRELGLWSLP